VASRETGIRIPAARRTPLWKPAQPQKDLAAVVSIAEPARTISNQRFASVGQGDLSQFHSIHQTLKITPTMAAGVTSRLWEMNDIVDVLEPWEAKGERPAAVA